MRIKRAALRLASFAGLCLLADAASAGAFLALDETSGSGAPIPMTMILGSDKIRMSNPKLDIIFRGDLGKLWLLRPSARAYMEVTPEGAERARARLAQRMAAMKDRLAAMPEAERKRVEAMISARERPAPPTYEKSGDERNVGEWRCTPYRTVSSGPAEIETCVARLSDLGLSSDDLKPFADLGVFAADIGGAWGGPQAAGYDSLQKQLGGDVFPIETTTHFPDSGRTIVTTLRTVRHDDPPPGTFDIPEGFHKLEIGGKP